MTVKLSWSQFCKMSRKKRKAALPCIVTHDGEPDFFATGFSAGESREVAKVFSAHQADHHPDEIPVYNAQIHRTGDRVRYQGRIITVPPFDADGNPVWE